jgi:hypothetical protein
VIATHAMHANRKKHAAASQVNEAMTSKASM